MNRIVSLRMMALLLPMAWLSGCASYYTHYAMFPAENSAGESRHVRIHWQSAEYPAWWPGADQATTMRVETQCSERIWRISDDSHDDAGACGTGLRACGVPEFDILTATGEPAGEDQPCMQVHLPAGAERVAEVGNSFDLLVSCRPAKAEARRGGDLVSQDYLRSSPVAYTVYARKVPRGSLSARLPDFDETQCQEE
ncbi:hypothetical protein [Marinobacter daepoensis]|uniref:hypothetical protein n=1 Tax=Marinobacter daepoensis TaxID=262077 RepID=UPI0004142AF1|nr:hypothetical protein [Marinobacter daepoensis]